jgi:hypothetical protein
VQKRIPRTIGATAPRWVAVFLVILVLEEDSSRVRPRQIDGGGLRSMAGKVGKGALMVAPLALLAL